MESYSRFTLVAICLGASASFADGYSYLDHAGLAALVAEHAEGNTAIGEPFPTEPLDCPYYRNATVDYIVSDQDGTPRVLLTSVQTTLAGYHLYPTILHVDASGTWLRTPVPRTADGWTHIHRSTDGMHIVLAMDNVPESPDWETRFVLSSNGGRSWSYGESIRKYVYFDVIRYFRMDDSGNGTVVEEYPGDVGGYEQAGYYVFETVDWGATWSDARYQDSFDASGFVDTHGLIRSRNDGRRPLSDIRLPGFDCPGLEPESGGGTRRLPAAPGKMENNVNAHQR